MQPQLFCATIERFGTVPLIARWIALSILLLIEFTLLSIRFDSRTLIVDQGFLGVIVDKLPILPEIFAVVLTATLIFGTQEIGKAWLKLSLPQLSHRLWHCWLGAHLGAFLIFALVTRELFEVNHGSSVLLILVWFLLGLVSLLTWLASAVAPDEWWTLFRQFSSPLLVGLLIGFSGWVAGEFTSHFWGPLAYNCFQLVALILTSLGIEVVQDIQLFVIGTTEFSVRIAPECSGYEGMGLATVFVLSYLWWRRNDHHFPISLLLIPLSVLLMFLANAFRIAILILIGHWGWQEIASGGFHSQAGWIAFNLVVLGVVVFARSSPLLCRNIAIPVGPTEPSIAIPLLTPFLVLMITTMVTSAVQSGFDWLYPSRVIAVVLALCCLKSQFPRQTWLWSFDWFAPVIGMAVYFIWIALESIRSPESGGSSQVTFDPLHQQSLLVIASWYFFRVIGSVVFVPVAEEFAFRGYLMAWLSPKVAANSSPRFSLTALLISSSVFGALHPGRWIAGTAAGLLFGLAFYRRRCLMDAVIAHAIANGLIALQVLCSSQHSLWS